MVQVRRYTSRVCHAGRPEAQPARRCCTNKRRGSSSIQTYVIHKCSMAAENPGDGMKAARPTSRSPQVGEMGAVCGPGNRSRRRLVRGGRRGGHNKCPARLCVRSVRGQLMVLSPANAYVVRRKAGEVPVVRSCCSRSKRRQQAQTQLSRWWECAFAGMRVYRVAVVGSGGGVVVRRQ